MVFSRNFDVFHFDLRGDSLRTGLCGNAGCLICLISSDGYIGIECFYGVLMYFTMICAAIRLEFGLSGIAGCLI